MDISYPKNSSRMPSFGRRESLLTRAIVGEPKADDAVSQHKQYTGRGLSTASSHSATSMASTAELISDHSPARSCSPSPPVPNGFTGLPGHKPSSTSVMIAPVTKDEKAAVADIGEAAVEKTLGRRRCIMFACAEAATPEPKKEEPKPEPEPPKRKCALTFMCPSRKDDVQDTIIEAPRREQRKPLPATAPAAMPDSTEQQSQTAPKSEKASSPTTPVSPQTFHEFGSSHDETDAWVNSAQQHKEKLTVKDCMKKENAIRKLGEEAEEEAEEEEREAEALDDIDEDPTQEDDFAPSDDGNDSDDEAGFADSDDESDAGSDHQFWAPAAQSSTTGATSTENLSHFSNRGRSRASSLESIPRSDSPARSSERPLFMKRPPKLPRMRPGTPELPDSTDFVCGTLDEDRPLEAAYISCLEQRKREKHIPIPQDIDPSFPTSDPEDEEDEEDEDESPGAGGPMWMKDQFAELDGAARSRTPREMKSPTPPSPRNEHPLPKLRLSRRNTNRSPPPKARCRSPPPPAYNLFDHRNDSEMRPPPHMRLRSPPGSPSFAPSVAPHMEIGQRPFGRGHRERTSSLPRTPNPFFKRFNVGSPSISNVASGAVTPATEEPPRSDLHVRGPVDIVMGLERKRQKRKEKFWRQHCRKAAKEYAERKQVPGRGAVRMKELGLECAERNRGYGTQGPAAQVVLSL